MKYVGHGEPGRMLKAKCSKCPQITTAVPDTSPVTAAKSRISLCSNSQTLCLHEVNFLRGPGKVIAE
jgi:hypothetical protein